MSRFVKRETVKVDLGEGDWIEIRKKLNYEDRVDIEKKLFNIRSATDMIKLHAVASRALAWKEGDPEPETPDVNLADSNIEMLVRVIVTWGGPGFCVQEQHPHEGVCVPRPINRENVAQLDDTAEEILMAVRNIMVTKTPDFTSPPSPASPTEEEAAATAAPNGDSTN